MTRHQEDVSAGSCPAFGNRIPDHDDSRDGEGGDLHGGIQAMEPVDASCVT
jgi:hypothetical protein